MFYSRPFVIDSILQKIPMLFVFSFRACVYINISPCNLTAPVPTMYTNTVYTKCTLATSQFKLEPKALH